MRLRSRAYPGPRLQRRSAVVADPGSRLQRRSAVVARDGLAAVDLEDVPPPYAAEVEAAARKVLQLGRARGRLTFLGMGATGIVFCDERPRAFKVARLTSRQTAGQTLANEAEWLSVAATLPPYLRSHVARYYAYDPRHAILERECVASKRRPYQTSRMWEIWLTLKDAMKEYGFSGPEFKEDSFVFAPGRGWVLVDAGFAHFRGARLVRQATELLRASLTEPVHSFDLTDAAFALRAEAGRTVDPARAERLSRRLLQVCSRLHRGAMSSAR